MHQLEILGFVKLNIRVDSNLKNVLRYSSKSETYFAGLTYS